MTNSPWQERAETKRRAILEAIPQRWRLHPDSIPTADEQPDITGPYLHQFLELREIEITECNAATIAQKTTTGQWSAVEVTEAFCHRAALAHQYVNCLHEFFPKAALEDAKRLDAFFSTHQKPLGPLHGLPISLKDQFHIKDIETTMGYVGWIGQKPTSESELVRELRALGAVLYCKTSVPTGLMSGETANNIINYTWNPRNRRLSAGGSSGGEGALLALRGSPLGFGTDIGGSIRVPAAFNGLYGLRPSGGRIPYEGAANSMDGQNTVLSVVGPMAPTVGALRLAMKSVLSQEPWMHDPLAVPIPWREEIEQRIRRMLCSASERKQMAFGVLEHDGVVTPHPPVKRALRLVREALVQLGHEVIDWKPPSHMEGGSYAYAAYTLDAGHDIKSQCEASNELIIPQLNWILSHDPPTQKPASEIHALNVAKRRWQKAYLDYWNSTAEKTTTGRPVDAVICPATIMAAALPMRFVHPGSTSFVNVLDYSAVTVPVTHVDREVDVCEWEEGKSLNPSDESLAREYDPRDYDGAPVGLQLIARQYDEEKILVLAEYIGAAIRGVNVDNGLWE